jgi:hypothetical protein
MMSERALVEAIFDTALKGTAGETAARREGLWTAATTLMATKEKRSAETEAMLAEWLGRKRQRR